MKSNRRRRIKSRDEVALVLKKLDIIEKNPFIIHPNPYEMLDYTLQHESLRSNHHIKKKRQSLEGGLTCKYQLLKRPAYPAYPKLLTPQSEAFQLLESCERSKSIKKISELYCINEINKDNLQLKKQIIKFKTQMIKMLDYKNIQNLKVSGLLQYGSEKSTSSFIQAYREMQGKTRELTASQPTRISSDSQKQKQFSSTNSSFSQTTRFKNPSSLKLPIHEKEQKISAEIPTEIPAGIPAEIPAGIPAEIPAEIPNLRSKLRSYSTNVRRMTQINIPDIIEKQQQKFDSLIQKLDMTKEFNDCRYFLKDKKKKKKNPNQSVRFDQ